MILALWLDMIQFERRYIRTDIVEGISYYYIDYDFFNLKEFADYFDGGVIGGVLDFLDLELPDTDLCDYVPRNIVSGTLIQEGRDPVPVWEAPANLYLLGATVDGAGDYQGLSNFLIFRIGACYTIYPPDDEGVTFIPDFEPPADPYEPMARSGDYVLYGYGDELTNNAAIPICQSNTVVNWTMYNARMIGKYWSGAIPNPNHFLARLEDFTHYGADTWEQITMLYAGATWGIKENGGPLWGIYNDAIWDMPQPYNWYESSNEIIFWATMYKFPPEYPAILAFQPATVDSGGFKPWLLPGANITDDYRNDGMPKTGVGAWKPYIMDGEQLLMNDLPLTTRGM
jgi:hypothetical protein